MESLAKWIGDLFGGSNVADGMPTFTTNAGLQESIGSKAGEMTDILGRGVDSGLAGGLAGVLGDFDLMDMGKLGLGYMGMKEQQKVNKKNNKLTDQNIAENDRITLAREDLKRKFAQPSLAATRV